MVNFGELAAEIISLVWGTPANFNGFRVLAALLHGSGRQSNYAALNRGHHVGNGPLHSGYLSIFVICVTQHTRRLAAGYNSVHNCVWAKQHEGLKLVLQLHAK